MNVKDLVKGENHTTKKAVLISSEKAADYVYIVGHGHSGTTLLELLLGRHPKIVITGELEKMSLQFARDESAPYQGLCSCGNRPQKCPFWAQVANVITEQYDINISDVPFRFRVSDIGREEDYGIRSLRHWFLYKYCRFWRTMGYGCNSLFLQNISFLSLFPRRWAMNRLFVVYKCIHNAIITYVKHYKC